MVRVSSDYPVGESDPLPRLFMLIEAEDATAQDIAQVAALVPDLDALSDSPDSNAGRTPLGWAHRHRRRDLVRALIGAGASPSTNGWGALATAVVVGDVDAAAAVLSEDPLSIVEEDIDGRTAFLLAAFYDDLPMLTLLAANGADVEERGKSGETALHVAAGNGRLEMARWLLDHGADIEARDEFGISPLMEAVGMDYHVAAMLVEHGANVNAIDEDGVSILSALASIEGAAPALRLLVDAGAKIDYVDGFEESPLISAVSARIEENVKVLLELGADTEQTSDGATALRLAASSGDEGVVRLLLESGANVNAQDEDGGTPLHCATDANMVGIVNLLLAAGANANVADDSGLRPIEYCRSVEIAEAFVAAGESVDPPVATCGTALIFAAGDGNLELALLFLRHGADIHAQNLLGCTALMVASSRGCIEIVKALLAAGARVDDRDRDGCTALANAAAPEAFALFKTTVEWSAMEDSMQKSMLELESSDAATDRDSVEHIIGDRAASALVNNLAHRRANAPDSALQIEVVDILLAAGADIEAASHDGATPLLLCAANGDAKRVAHLIDCGSNLGAVDRHAKTVADYAASHEDPQHRAAILELLGPDAPRLCRKLKHRSHRRRF